ncbi:MAG TPA: aspartate aminotransferase family protein [Bacteroidia bacterium]|nr:aspartate aminotransferase family protein [Bacteroidia bacterium]
MLTHRQLFLNHVAQTSDDPLMLEIIKAEGVELTDINEKIYVDLISGISVSNVGHRHPQVVKAIKKQLDQYMHLMVYGEYIQSPQTLLAKALSDCLPKNFNSCYFVNSGTEAIEGAMKLAKRFTGRTEIIAFKNAYHGSTQGALSLMSNEYFKNSFRPLLPGIRFIEFNNKDDLKHITKKTACVAAEVIQGEAGAIVPEKDFHHALRQRCDETGTLLISDEIQTGFGRTGTMFAFEQYDFIPDVLVLAKGMGGGMPIGTFISSKEIMNCLTNNPALGHITTFGGHPVSCAASLATLKIISEMNLKTEVEEKEKLFREKLVHPKIKNISGKGLMLAVEFKNAGTNKRIIKRCIENGVITDWFLFAENKMRIAPPLIINNDCIINSCELILKSIDESVK